MDDISYASATLFDDVAANPHEHMHLVVIATKPDIIKQVPLYKELRERGHLVLLGHTGQHYDENLSGGMLREFGVEPDFNLNVRGSAYQVVSQIIGRLGYVIGELKSRGKIVIPYVHGDTTTAMAAANAGYCHGFAAVHVEAGIRTLTPNYSIFFGEAKEADESKEAKDSSASLASSIKEWHSFLQSRSNWHTGSQEPFPEQFNTRCSEAATGVHLAPVELDREFLLSEGFSGDRIFVVGNSVADATNDALARIDKATVFDRFPRLAEGDFVRFCIHRGENCSSPERFRAIYDAMKGLILDGRGVLLISLFKTEAALEAYGLKEEVGQLARDHDNFIYSPVWPEYTDVIAAMSKAAVCATDSGSMQEEMNVMGVPCVTLRFGSDRSESIINGGNIIAPPVDATFIKTAVEYAWDNQEMRSAPKIYGENVSARCIDCVEQVLSSGAIFRTEEQRLGFGST